MSLGFGFGFPRRLTSGGGLSPRLYLDFVGTNSLPSTVTFSRGTNATLTDSNGRVAWAPHNLLTNSEDFEAAGWVKLNGTVVSNQAVAPDGTTTAELLYPTTTGTFRGFYQTFTASVGAYTTTVYAKAAGLSGLGLTDLAGGSAAARFDLVSGTVGFTAAGYTASIQSVGNGWYRCSVTGTAAAGLQYVYAYACDSASTNTATTSGTSGIFIWGAQLNVANAPVNLLTWSEQFDNAAWVKTNATVTTNQEVAPDGTLSVDSVAFTTGTKRLLNNSPSAQTAGTSLTFSIYAKGAAGGEQIRIWDGWTTTTAITLTTTLTRYSVTVSANGTSNGFYLDCLTNGATIFLWGAQLNTGSVALPYVATTSSIYLPPAYNPTTPKNLLGFTQEPENAAWTKSNSYVQQNLLTWSQDFDNAAWVNNGGTVTANALVAPDGSTTADYLVRSTAAADGRYQTITAGTSGVVTASVYIKKDTSPQSLIWLYDATAVADRLFATVTWSGSTPVITAATGTAATPQDAGNGWWRIAITSTALTGANTNRLYLLPAYTAASNGQQTAFWGAQLVQGSTAGDYTQTTSAAAPTRYLNWDGTLTGRKLVETTANAQHSVFQAQTLTAGTYTLSVYAKADQGPQRWLQLYPQGTGVTAAAIFDINAGAVTATTGAQLISSAIVSVGNGWYRCSITFTGAAVSVTNVLYLSNVSNLAAPAYTGDGTSGIYVSDFQLSNSASVDPYVYNPQAAAASAAFYGPRFDYNPTGIPATFGAELVTNGNFSAGSTGWTVNAGWAITSQQAVATATSSSLYGGSLTSISGQRYRVEFDVVSYTSGDLYITVGGNYSGNPMLTGSAMAAGRKTVYVLGGANTTRGVEFYGGTITCSIDNISVQEVTGYTATANGLLIEEQRTNLLTYSEQFDNAVWSAIGAKNVVANSAVAPDGTTTADTLSDNSAAAFQGIQQGATVAVGTQTYTASCYVRKTTGGTSATFGINLSITGGTIVAVQPRLNTDTGVVIGGTGIVQDAGNYWRLIASVTNNNTAGNTSLSMGIYPATGTYNSNVDVATATGSAVIWGSQLELGSFATSYVPTQASQVTRNADSASMLGDNFYTWYNPNQFVYSVEFVPGVVSNNNVAITFSDGTNDNRAFTSAGTAEHLVVNTGGVSQAFLDGGTAVLGVVNKIAAGVAVNNFGVSVNGGVTATDTSGTVPPLTSMNIGNYRGISSFLNGTIRRIGYYNTRLPDSTLQALTTT